MDKRGVVGMVGMIITATLLLILIASLVIPQVSRTVRAQVQEEDLVRDDEANQENVTLSITDGLVADSLSISGLTLEADYQINYTTGVVGFNTTTANGTYTSTYEYYDSVYFDTANERVLMALVTVGVILGAIYFLFRGFGLV